MDIMRTPKSIDLEITSKCNLRCKYCSHFSTPGDTDYDLPKEEWLKFFYELGRCAVMYVTFQGGEALIREDLKELIHGIVQNRMRFSILSNGTLITDDMTEFLASIRRCNSVQISIDGSIPMTHESFRGKGTFALAIEGIRLLQRHNVPVDVRVTIHRKNVGDLKGIARLLLEDIGIPSFSTNSASYMGLCRQNTEQVQLTVEERVLAMEELLRLNRKYNGRITANAGPLAEGRTWLKMEKARLGLEDNISENCGYLIGCRGPMNTLAVRADGVILPCSQLPHIHLGRINHDNLQEIWQNHPELNRLRERCHIPLSNFEFCKGCDYINNCTGSCPALAYNQIGRDDHPSPSECLRQFLENGGRLPDERLFSIDA